MTGIDKGFGAMQPSAEPDPNRAGSELPIVSAIVPAYNAGAHLEACLRSILDQQGPFRLEIIVIDDGSSDDTAERAIRLLPLATARGVDLRVLRQPNAGPSAARNRGIAAARGDWLALLDSDDLWPAERLATQLALSDADPGLGLIFGDCERFVEVVDSTGHGMSRVVELPSFFADAGLDEAFFGHPSRVIDPLVKLFRINYVPTGSVLMRRACVEQAGGFDPACRLVEDLDLWLRAARDCRFGYTRALCQRKRVHSNNLSADLAAMTLANIRVLTAHWRPRSAELRRRGLRLRPYLAHEYCLLGDYRERAGRCAEARRYYLRAFATAPGPRPLYYWLRCLLRRPRT